jgi:hypothetical protein
MVREPAGVMTDRRITEAEIAALVDRFYKKMSWSSRRSSPGNAAVRYAR